MQELESSIVFYKLINKRTLSEISDLCRFLQINIDLDRFISTEGSNINLY